MEFLGKRMRSDCADQAASDSDSDSDFDADGDGRDACGCAGITATEALSRIRSALAQLPTRSARKETVLLQNRVKGMLSPVIDEHPAVRSAAERTVLDLTENEHGLLQLLPHLLETQYEPIVLGALEIVSALALHSTETNWKLASRKNVVAALTGMLESRRLAVLLATCYSLNDIMVTSLGRNALKEAGALEGFMRLLCGITDHDSSGRLSNDCGDNMMRTARTRLNERSMQVHGDGLNSGCGVSSSTDVSDVVHEEWEELFVTCMEGACHLSAFPITGISSTLHAWTLSNLQKLWWKNRTKAEGQIFSKQQSILARFIVRLSMDSEFLSGYKGILKFTSEDFLEVTNGDFFTTCWEVAPAVLNFNISSTRQAFFSCLKEAVCGDSEDLLVQLLSGISACPLVPADELESQSIFKCLGASVGGPLIYGQDVRLVKTETVSKEEKSRSSRLPEKHYFRAETLARKVHPMDCVDAFKWGYTVALRGMEFRNPQVAAVADCLAIVLGQASVGVNLYLTPSDAQGLAAHYDDHCVFVCQISGHKHWSVYSAQHVLPRLYDTRCSVREENATIMEVLLEEGDWLYIPRGFPHQAYSCRDCIGKSDNAGLESRGNQGPSLHLTFGVQVEPPFEWEGLIHVALQCFIRKNMAVDVSTTTMTQRSQQLTAILLHIAVKQMGSKCPALRKACTIASSVPEAAVSMTLQRDHSPTTCTTCASLGFDMQLPEGDASSEGIFHSVLCMIGENASFDAALDAAREAVSQKTVDKLSWMDWFRHLPISADNLLPASDPIDLLADALEHDCSDEFEPSSLQSNFASLKEAFVSNACFTEACASFNSVLTQYRDSRRKLMNGLLALHADLG